MAASAASTPAKPVGAPVARLELVDAGAAVDEVELRELVDDCVVSAATEEEDEEVAEEEPEVEIAEEAVELGRMLALVDELVVPTMA